MAAAKTVSVSILDKEYQVNCQEHEVAALQKSAVHLDARMREMKQQSNVLGLDRLAIMAALNLANDLLTESAKASQLDAHKAELGKLEEKLNSALAGLKAKFDQA